MQCTLPDRALQYDSKGLGANMLSTCMTEKCSSAMACTMTSPHHLYE